MSPLNTTSHCPTGSKFGFCLACPDLSVLGTLPFILCSSNVKLLTVLHAVSYSHDAISDIVSVDRYPSLPNPCPPTRVLLIHSQEPITLQSIFWPPAPLPPHSTSFLLWHNLVHISVLTYIMPYWFKYLLMGLSSLLEIELLKARSRSYFVFPDIITDPVLVRVP